jgi:hypothetical protein
VLQSIFQHIFAHPLLSGLVLAVLAEAVTCFTRFVLGFRARDNLHLVTRPTFGVRVHHGYLGFGALGGYLLFSPLFRSGSFPWCSAAVIVGIGLVLSDLVHHLVVLRLLTGDHEFP